MIDYFLLCANRLEMESNLKMLRGRKASLQEGVERLWSTATFGSGFGNFPAKTESHPSSTPGASILAKEDWKKAVASLFIKVIATNMAEEEARKKAQKEDKERRRAEAQAAAEREVAAAADNKAGRGERERFVPSAEPTDSTGDAAHRYFIIEVLAKVLARNTVREGLRRVSLQEFLRRQEHALLLQYGTAEYKQQAYDRLLMEREEEDRRRWLQASAEEAQRMSGALVQEALDQARDLAAVKLFDSWVLLDDDPATWLSQAQLEQLEASYKRSKAAFEVEFKRKAFFNISKDYRVKRFIKVRELCSCAKVWCALQTYTMRRRGKHRSATVVQQAARAFVYRARWRRHWALVDGSWRAAETHSAGKLRAQAWRALQHWRQHASLARRFKDTVACLKDRRFILTFYIWRDQFMKHKYRRLINSAEQLRAVAMLQCTIRCALSRRRFLLLRSQRRIALGIRCFLARRAADEQRRMCRRLADFADGACSTQHLHSLRRALSVWKKAVRIQLGLVKVDRAVRNDKMRRRFSKWNKYRIHRTKILTFNAILVQSVIRMWIVHKYVLKYYRWRRGFVAFQGAYRRHVCRLQYAYDIYYYRAAKSIQKVARGHLRRLHINDARVADIHYAAAHNNYDRLKYYVDRFPELVGELDTQGNSAVHAAASTASKRTLKLLVRFQLDPNLQNNAGYTPMHLLIMSVSPQRDECFLYMIERGFDDNIRAPQNMSCLLLACEYGRTIIARHLMDEEDHDTNLAADDGLTCLQTACMQGNVALVKDLIDNEAEVNAPGRHGSFPLHDVTHSGSVDIANNLLSHGAYVNVYEPHLYQTPLMWAASAGADALVHLYTLHGAEVNARDANGQSAAHLGAISGNGQVYNALREAECDFDAMDNTGNRLVLMR